MPMVDIKLAAEPHREGSATDVGYDVDPSARVRVDGAAESTERPMMPPIGIKGG
jgi:hypothetical protein